MSERTAEPDALSVLASAELVFNKQQIDFAIDQLAAKLSVEYADTNPVIVCVMSGGLVFTADLITRLRFPLTLDYLHASRYHENLSGEGLQWHVLPQSDMAGRTVIIVDDVLDYGITLAEVIKQPVFENAAQVKIVVMLDKLLGRSKPVYADYAALQSDERYAFGRGMDCRGYWRNLPEIYALPAED